MNRIMMLAMFMGFSFIFTTPVFSESQDPCSNLDGLDPEYNLAPNSSTHEHCLQFMVCTQLERVQIACEMRNAILDKYALIELKKERLGLDAEEHLNSCVQLERGIQDSDNLSFLDRMQKCIAKFQDSHFNLNDQMPRPIVTNGIIIREVDRKFYISEKYKRHLQFIADTQGIGDLNKILSIGAEILEVDGKTVDEWVQRYEPYISASSNQYRRDRAVRAVFRRNFLYPDKKSADLKIKVNGTIELIRLPWFWISDSHVRIDAANYFEKIGIPSTDKVSWDYSKPDNKWSRRMMDNTGYWDSDPLIPTADLKEYLDQNEDAALRMGTHIYTGKKVFGYLQILTFATESVSLQSKQEGKKEVLPFMNLIRDFIKICKKKELPLVIDLRENGGGNNNYPEQLLSILTPGNKNSFAHGLGFPVNPHTGWLLSYFLRNPELEARNLGKFNATGMLYWDSYEKAISEEESFTNVILPDAVEADTDVGGYSENIVVLLTSKCASACEVTAGLLKNSGRATLVGSPSNGTGAGYMNISGTANIDASWRDSKDVLSIEIPSFVFVVPEKGFDATQHILTYQDYKKFIPENIPVEPDVPFSVPLSDILGDSNLWLDTAVNSLFPPTPARAPVEATPAVLQGGSESK